MLIRSKPGEHTTLASIRGGGGEGRHTDHRNRQTAQWGPQHTVTRPTTKAPLQPIWERKILPINCSPLIRSGKMS